MYALSEAATIKTIKELSMGHGIASVSSGSNWVGNSSSTVDFSKGHLNGASVCRMGTDSNAIGLSKRSESPLKKLLSFLKVTFPRGSLDKGVPASAKEVSTSEKELDREKRHRAADKCPMTIEARARYQKAEAEAQRWEGVLGKFLPNGVLSELESIERSMHSRMKKIKAMTSEDIEGYKLEGGIASDDRTLKVIAEMKCAVGMLAPGAKLDPGKVIRDMHCGNPPTKQKPVVDKEKFEAEAKLAGADAELAKAKLDIAKLVEAQRAGANSTKAPSGATADNCNA